jgi:hypothetical protein
MVTAVHGSHCRGWLRGVVIRPTHGRSGGQRAATENLQQTVTQQQQSLPLAILRLDGDVHAIPDALNRDAAGWPGRLRTTDFSLSGPFPGTRADHEG